MGVREHCCAAGTGMKRPAFCIRYDVRQMIVNGNNETARAMSEGVSVQ